MCPAQHTQRTQKNITFLSALNQHMQYCVVTAHRNIVNQRQRAVSAYRCTAETTNAPGVLGDIRNMYVPTARKREQTIDVQWYNVPGCPFNKLAASDDDNVP
jgi:hypothetical protein